MTPPTDASRVPRHLLQPLCRAVQDTDMTSDNATKTLKRNVKKAVARQHRDDVTQGLPARAPPVNDKFPQEWAAAVWNLRPAELRYAIHALAEALPHPGSALTVGAGLRQILSDLPTPGPGLPRSSTC